MVEKHRQTDRVWTEDRSATPRNAYLEVEVKDGRHVGALWETLKEEESYGEESVQSDSSERVIQQQDSGAHLLLLQVVADSKVPVARLALWLEPGTIGRDRQAHHVASLLTGLPKSWYLWVMGCVSLHIRGVAEAHIFISSQFIHEVHHLRGAAVRCKTQKQPAHNKHLENNQHWHKTVVKIVIQGSRTHVVKLLSVARSLLQSTETNCVTFPTTAVSGGNTSEQLLTAWTTAYQVSATSRATTLLA